MTHGARRGQWNTWEEGVRQEQHRKGKEMRHAQLTGETAHCSRPDFISLSLDQGLISPLEPTRLPFRGRSNYPSMVAGVGVSGEPELGLGLQHGENMGHGEDGDHADVGLRDGMDHSECP